MMNNSVLQFIRFFKIQIAIFLLITGTFGTIGPAFFHLHSSKDLTVCKQENAVMPIFYQFVNDDALQDPVWLEKQPNHIHFVLIEEDCLVCNLSYKTNFEIPDLPFKNSFFIKKDSFLSYYSSSLLSVSAATTHNKGSPAS